MVHFLFSAWLTDLGPSFLGLCSASHLTAGPRQGHPGSQRLARQTVKLAGGPVLPL